MTSRAAVAGPRGARGSFSTSNRRPTGSAALPVRWRRTRTPARLPTRA